MNMGESEVLKCFVCSNIKLSNQNQFNDEFLIKLKVCVPEVKWDVKYQFCDICVNQVDDYYSFKNLCIQSYSRLRNNAEESSETCSNGYDDDYKLDSPTESLETVGEEIETTLNHNGNICNESSNTIMCFICSSHFSNKQLFAKHFKNEHNSKTAPEEPSQNAPFKEKIDESGNRKVYKCLWCEKAYVSRRYLKKHLEECSNKESVPLSSYNCENCNQSYGSKKAVMIHLETCNRNKVRQNDYDKKANLENKSSVSKSGQVAALSRMKKGRRPVRSYSCEVCGQYYDFARNVVTHAKKVHGMDEKSIKPYSCDVCLARFGCCANLIQHQKYHSKSRNHICTFCGKTYITKGDLIVHEYSHYNRRNYKCEECNKAFNTNKGLRTHHLVCHTPPEQWKHTCNLCGKSFPMKSGFDQHMKRHRGEKQFSCHLCEKTFISASEVKKHLVYHTNVKMFKCRFCSKEYKNAKHCEIHLAKVHNVGDIKIPVRAKKFTCHVCGHMFADTHKLERHMCTHTGLKPFGCDLCAKKFSDKSYLKSHRKTVHGISVCDPMGYS